MAFCACSSCAPSPAVSRRQFLCTTAASAAAASTVAGAIVGEFIASDQGLGYLMIQVQSTLDTAAMFMAVLLISLIGVTLYLLVLGLENAVVPQDARVR